MVTMNCDLCEARGEQLRKLRKGLQDLLTAADAYGRQVTDAEQKRFHAAWDAAVALLK